MRYEEEEKRLMNDWWDPVVRSVGRSVGWSVAGYTGTFARTLFYVRWCGRVVDRGIGGDDLFFFFFDSSRVR